jgi:alpha-glucosidase
MWWHNGVVYQVYPRSFQDSDGDGIGDLRGIASRLNHLAHLGVDAVWLSPVYPSPQADFGYDVSDFTSIDPLFGTLEDFDALLAAAHDRGLRLLMDLVPCHTSIEHPWFREHPDFYVRRPASLPDPPNNWLASFGGRAWDRDPQTGEWYLHSFYPEQPDLDWRNPALVAAMQDAMRFWLDRGVDGFRLDALDRLLKDAQYRDDPVAAGPPPLPLHADHGSLDHLHSRNAPDIGMALAALREAAGDKLLVGEVYLPTAELGPYLAYLDLCFCFELYHAPWQPQAVRDALRTALAEEAGGRLAWVLSNHDFARLPTRVGPGNEAVAAMLLLTLPGCAFVYQGDELGMPDGPGGDPPLDRAGRDAYRHPMAWTAEPKGGFTTGTPWLPVVEPAARNVAAQAEDPRSLLSLYRRLIALRRELEGPVEFVDGTEDVLTYRRGEHLVALSFADQPRAIPAGEIVVASDPGATPGTLAPRAGVVVRVG